MSPEAGLPALGAFAFWKENNNLKKRKMQHVAKISCINGVEGEY